MVLFPVLLTVAIVLGIIGVAVEGMLYLLPVGVLLLIADVGYLAGRSTLRRRPYPLTHQPTRYPAAHRLAPENRTITPTPLRPRSREAFLFCPVAG